jgi:hypothetical protein
VSASMASYSRVLSMTDKEYPLSSSPTSTVSIDAGALWIGGAGRI